MMFGVSAYELELRNRLFIERWQEQISEPKKR